MLCHHEGRTALSLLSLMDFKVLTLSAEAVPCALASPARAAAPARSPVRRARHPTLAAGCIPLPCRRSPGRPAAPLGHPPALPPPPPHFKLASSLRPCAAGARPPPTSPSLSPSPPSPPFPGPSCRDRPISSLTPPPSPQLIMQHYLHDTATRERVAAMTGWTHFNERETPPGRRAQALSGALWHSIPTVSAAEASPNGGGGDGGGHGDGSGGNGGAGGLEPVRLTLAAYRPPGQARVPFATAAAAAYTPAAVGEVLGPAWATVWFRVDLELPSWVAALPEGAPPPAAAGHTCPPGVDDRLCLVWDAGGEALMWSADGRPRSGLVGGTGMCSRVDYNLREDVEAAAAAAATAAARAGSAAPAAPLRVQLYVEVACNGLFGVGTGGDIEPPDEAKTFALATARVALRCETAWTLLHDLTALGGIADALPDGVPQKRAALSAANNLVNAVRVRDLRRSADAASSAAAIFWASSPSAPGASTPTVAAVGHCHIDTAWLWVMAEARRKVARSWASQLRLLNEYPAYVFAASQALHYTWVEDAYPTLWQEVVAAVRQGVWSVVGGTWVEMDTNIPSPEALVRQFTVGQAYFRSRLGVRARTLWLPDTFGFAPQLPQVRLHPPLSAGEASPALPQQLPCRRLNLEFRGAAPAAGGVGGGGPLAWRRRPPWLLGGGGGGRGGGWEGHHPLPTSGTDYQFLSVVPFMAFPVVLRCHLKDPLDWSCGHKLCSDSSGFASQYLEVCG